MPARLAGKAARGVSRLSRERACTIVVAAARPAS